MGAVRRERARGRGTLIESTHSDPLTSYLAALMGGDGCADDELGQGLNNRLIGRAAALMLAAGGLLSLAGVVRPQAPGEDPLGVLFVGLASATIGLVLWYLPWDRWPRYATLVVVPIGFALIAARNSLGDRKSVV